MGTLLGDEPFWVGFGVALVLLLAARAVPLLRSPPRGGGVIGDGLVAATAALVGLAAAQRLPVALVVGLALLIVGDRCTIGRHPVAQMAAALPGGLVLGVAVTTNAPTWARAAAACAVVLLVPSVRNLDGDQPRLIGTFLAISALGVFGTVPDTEEARAVLGALLVAAAFGLSRRSADPGGRVALAGIVAWTAASGGFARPGAVVGGIACVAALSLWSWSASDVLPGPAKVSLHVVLVGVMSRVAGLRERAWAAVMIAAAAYLVVSVFVAVLARRATRSR